jgi:regulator of sirC expression with transglutaminase-like and TPR domain
MDFNIGWQNFYYEVDRQDESINLAKAALTFAQTEYPALDIDRYLKRLDLMADTVKIKLPQEQYPLKIIKTINSYLFEDLGYRGNAENYYNPANSFLNDVIDSRKGIPISLSVVYLEIAKRIDFPMVGIGMPGHFLIRPEFENAEIFIDTFEKGEILFKQDCEERLSNIYQHVYQHPVELKPYFLEPVSNRQILARMLTNLKFIYINTQELNKALRITEGILMLFPNNPREIRDRGLIYFQMGQWQQAADNLELYLAIAPDADDAVTIRELLGELKSN